MQHVSEQKIRYSIPDNLRGIALLSMILYHGCWDLVFLFGADIRWYSDTPGYLWQQSICWTFIFLSGFCQPLGSHPWKRGLLILGGGACLSIVTALLMPDSLVLFGVLTFLGSAVCLTTLLKPLLCQVPGSIGLFISSLCFLLTRNIPKGALGFESFELLALPESWYANLLTTYLGFPAPDFFSTDYFPLIPWLFLFLAGYYFYDIMERNQWLCCLRGRPLPLLSFMGRHSFLIYMLHQPILFSILTILFRYTGGL